MQKSCILNYWPSATSIRAAGRRGVCDSSVEMLSDPPTCKLIQLVLAVPPRMTTGHSSQKSQCQSTVQTHSVGPSHFISPQPIVGLIGSDLQNAYWPSGDKACLYIPATIAVSSGAFQALLENVKVDYSSHLHSATARSLQRGECAGDTPVPLLQASELLMCADVGSRDRLLGLETLSLLPWGAEWRHKTEAASILSGTMEDRPKAQANTHNAKV